MSYKIQPSGGDLRLRTGEGYIDQYDQVDETLTLWEELINAYNKDVEWLIQSERTNPLSGLTGCARLIGDPVGTGKSPLCARLIYALTTRLREMGVKKADGTLIADMPILVICDKRSKWQWIQYFRDWCAEMPLYKVVMLDGTKDDIATQFDVAKMIHTQVFILNYNKMVDYEDAIREHGPFLLVVLDEGRRIKNDSQRNQACDAVESLFRIILDGTPVTREPDSLYRLLSWLNPGPYKRRWEEHKIPIPKACTLGRRQKKNIRSMGGCEACSYFVPHTDTNYSGTCRSTKREVIGKPEGYHYYHQYSPEWGTFDEFKDRYCKMECNKCGSTNYAEGDYNMWSENDYIQKRCTHKHTHIVGSLRDEELRDRLYNKTKLMTRIDRRNIKGMPEVIPAWEETEMTAEQSRFYSQAEAGLLEWMDNEGEMNRTKLTNMLAQISYLRSFATIPPAVVLETMKAGGKMPEWLRGIDIPKSRSSGKTNWCIEFVSEQINGGDKVIFFSEWSRMTHDLLPRLNEELGENGWYAVEISGDQSEKKSMEAQIAFNSDPRCKALVCTPAGNAGLNLHEGVDHDGTLYLVNIDCSWLASDLEQRVGRGQRYGYKGHGAIVAYFLSSVKSDGGGTIDTRMASKVQSRANISDALTGTNLGDLFVVSSKSDLRSLLTGD